MEKISVFRSILILIVVAVGIGFWVVFEKSLNSAETLEKVTIAEANQMIGSLVYVASVKGYFEKEGLEVILQKYTTGKASLNAVLQGRADLATTAETPIMHAVMSKQKIYTLATIGTTTKNLALIGRKDHGIKGIHDLRGKKIGITLGTNGEFFLDTFLLNHLIAKNEIVAVSLKPEEMFDAVMKGEVDAVTTWNPHLRKIKYELGEKGILFGDESIYNWTWNIVGMQEFVKNNPETIKKVIRALAAAEELIRKDPKEAMRATAKYFKNNSPDLAEEWELLDLSLSLGQYFLTGIEAQARWAIKNKLTDQSSVPSFLDYIYADALKDVKPQAVTLIQ
ncbi:MAG: NrtA/SsuA/CpmA family ABC transporter substrate-binding protein [SAR324 cluster bacterium]|nr:NrtA/SsuA/CpmA family ABC transporter substrate-binding protein [SAR324 cluster bacterium]